MFDIIDNDNERVYIVQNEELVHVNLLEEKIMDFMKKDERDIVLDLKHLVLIDSVTLSVLIRIKRKVTAEGRLFTIINYNQTILRVIQLSGLESFLLE